MVPSRWSVVGVTVVGGRWSVVGGWSVGSGFVLRLKNFIVLQILSVVYMLSLSPFIL